MANWVARLQEGARRAQRAVATTLEREQIALIMGKTAGRTVEDGTGGVVVEAGHAVDRDVVERALKSGRLGALVAAVATAQVQDIQERASQLRASSDDGREQGSLDTVEEYVRARSYVGRVAVVDVTDVRGAVVIPAGTRLTEDHVRQARSANLLGALVFSASQPQPAESTGSAGKEQPQVAAETDVVSPPRRRLPLLDPSSSDDRSR